MFRIGEFSRIARVSCRLLRYYDELGLLRPARIEGDTGYRYYSAAQLPRLNRILVLKEVGLSLDEIAKVLEDGVSAAELRGMLLVRRADAERAVAAESERLRLIETRIAQVEVEGRLDDADVIIRAEPARLLLSVRRVLASFAEARALIREICESVPRRVPREVLGQFTAVAHAQEFEADRLDVELGFTLARDIPERPRLADGEALAVIELPAEERMATCVRVGLPEQAHLVTGRIGRIVEANGYRLAGAGREVFLQPPPLDRMHESVVEMQFPLGKVSA